MFAKSLIDLINYSLRSHLERATNPSQALRHSDGRTPYGVHPVWSAITLLQETEVPEDVRYDGAVALLFHDLAEDTDAPYPDELSVRARAWAEAMTYSSTREENDLIWGKPAPVKLLTLIEKTNTLLDANWMTDHGRDFWCGMILRLADDVERAYGTLNIVIAARNLARFRKSKGFRSKAVKR